MVRAWKMCSQQRVMQIRQPQSSMIAGVTIRRNQRASLRIIKRAKERIENRRACGRLPLKGYAAKSIYDP